VDAVDRHITEIFDGKHWLFVHEEHRTSCSIMLPLAPATRELSRRLSRSCS
jgi:hypothetical protein